MHITLSPVRRAADLAVTRSGDVLTIDGKAYDFTSLPDGATIPAGEVPCDWITGPVERREGRLHLTLILPHGPNPPPHMAHPAPVIDPPDGVIVLPRAEESGHVET